ncbi:MAG: ABC transporter permease [Pantoea sp.]|uniref:ABC transporter permease n=1 Tax=Pantoea TaxID=53335 RepID=UPI00065FCE2D|nr:MULTISPECIES: ABC transporter permease [Pantoea]MBS6435286.1 ABC transporter permease [Pantoea sp.]MDU2729975.1 ABC transporter permease [Pantoea sp.]MDU6079816.1 ABC transporter permease [Pantoea sp.]MDU7836809.1 ABC transporter permease [Pantoea sp.]
MQAILQRVSFALPAAVWAAIVFLFLLLLAVVAPQWLAHSDPLLADPLNAQLPPSAQHWLGTDQLGRDLLTRVIYGSRYSLLISVAAMALAVLFGTLLGLAAALARGIVDELLSRAVDVISAFPDLLLALMLIAFTGPGTSNLIIALGVASVPRFARVVRAQTWRVMTSGYVEQARTFGLSRSTLILRHILPHAIAQVPALATLGLGTAIIGTAGLSFLGMGPQPPTAEWGLMLAEGRNYLRNAWWIAVWPGVFITLTVIAVNTLGRYWQARFEGGEA